MCGICGQFNHREKSPVPHINIMIMTHNMKHRGPDDAGYYLAGPVGLGFRRLSIIDLEGGHQPMSDQQQKVWVVFNGEIYNFRELRSELKAYGHTFKTLCDTEVIVYGYKQWGQDVLNRLNGMFALAIWDTEKQSMLLARDRFGIKPLYYTLDQDRVLFASEVRALLMVLDRKLGVDLTALNLFLRYRYTPSPLTLHKDIYKLAPGTCLLVSEEGVQRHCWYNAKPAPFRPMPSLKQAEHDLDDIYKAAIKRHLVSDVPVGLLLSGGIDSALLLALMNRSGSQWPTFTVGYGKSFKDDELEAAAESADFFSASHRSLLLNRQEFETTLPEIVASLEEPVATSSIVPLYHICKLASEKVKVALIGQGPDEFFGGYERHLGVYYGKYWRALPAWLRTLFKLALERGTNHETIKRGLYSLDIQERLKRYQQVFSIMPEDEIDSLFYDETLPPATGDMIFQCWAPYLSLLADTDELGGFQALELRSSLPDELLIPADKLSMAHSLELRVPYLDKELVEYVACLPAHYKIHLGTRKRLHRMLARHYLPATILARKKRRFAANVVDDWFRQSVTSRMHDAFEDSSSLMYNYLKPARVQKLFTEHQSGQRSHYKILFSLIVFEEWLRYHTA